MKAPYEVIKTVRVTEKGTAQSEKNNQYQVVVDKHANKLDIKYAVEQAFKVKVIGVNTMHVRGKPRREVPCDSLPDPSALCPVLSIG